MFFSFLCSDAYMDYLDPQGQLLVVRYYFIHIAKGVGVSHVKTFFTITYFELDIVYQISHGLFICYTHNHTC